MEGKKYKTTKQNKKHKDVDINFSMEATTFKLAMALVSNKIHFFFFFTIHDSKYQRWNELYLQKMNYTALSITLFRFSFWPFFYPICWIKKKLYTFWQI